MATVNRTSLRDALEELKARSAALHEAPEPELAEYRALVADQNALLELIATVLLEKLTPRSSRNSSIPPSQTDGDGDPTSRSRNRKKREEVPESPASTRTREEHHVHEAHACKHCGEKLTGTEATDHERRTRIDVVFEKVVEHHDAEIRHCPHCHGETRAAFPDDLHGPRQYGVGIRVFAVHQLMQMVPLRRTVQSLSAMIGEKLSEATLLGFLTRVHKALAGWEARARQYLLAMPAMHVDETSLRVEKKKPWIHVYSAGEITLKFLHGKRGREAIDDIGLIPKYRNVIIHDCHAPYLSYDHCSHGLCGAHLLRDITFIIDAVNPRWARRMKKLLRDYARRVAKSDECILTDREFRVLRQQYRTILTQARTQHELPPVPPRTKGQRGPVAKPASVTLWQRLKTREADILRFAHDPAVAFTNNRAERDLRMAKVKQKVSGCFRNAAFAKVYCRVSSYLQSMAYSGYSPFQAIHIALAGHAADYVPAAGGAVCSSSSGRGVRPCPGAPGCWPRRRFERGGCCRSLFFPYSDLDSTARLERRSATSASSSSMRAAIPARSSASARACRSSPAFSRRSEPIVALPVRTCPRRDAFLRLKAALLRRSDTTMAPGFGGHPFASSNSCSRSTSACNDSASRAVRRTAFTSSRAFASLARAALNIPRYVPASQRASSSARRHRCASASATAARASASSARPRSYRSCPPASSAAASGNDQLPSPSCTRVSPTPTSPIAMPATIAQCRLSSQPQSPDDGTLTSGL